MLLSASKGSPPGALAVRIKEALPLLAAAGDGARALPRLRAEPLPQIPNDLYPVSGLHTLEEGQREDLTEYQVATGGYLISVLTPPVCYALELQRPRDTDPWLLWGAFEDEARPVVAIHVQTTKHMASILWPLGAIAKLGKGTARVFSSIVGTIEDGVTGGGSEPVASPVTKRDHCDVQLLRDGRPVEPVLCQCSGHTFDAKRAAFVPRKGSTAAFFYFGWQTFKSTGASPPEIVLNLFDPSRPDESESVQIPRKMLELIAADFEPMRRYQQGLPHPPMAAGASGPAIFLVRLRGGSVLRALEVMPRGSRDMGLVLEAGGRILVAGAEVDTISDEAGNDWTTRVVTERKGVPEGR